MEVAQVASELAHAIELTMDPRVPQQQRMEAYTACERFKETSELCAQCGFYLAEKTNVSHFVRHFGLQLMEHCIKYRWYKISQQEKIFIKENAMKLLGRGTEPALQEHNHIKDALSRVIVEMIKREWPQQWPSLLTELHEACTLGVTQTELVMYVFLRLVEDVALLQTLESNQRRKDIYQALTTNMGEIFSFFIKLIEAHEDSFRTLNAQGQTQEAAGHARVIQVVMLTLTGFVEWVSISYIMANDGRLIHILCVMLENENFQAAAVECLLQIVSRKGRVEDRRPLLVLFNIDSMGWIFRAADAASNKPGDERHYFFLKKLTQVLTGLGTQLSTLWGKDDSLPGRPANFAMYLDTILKLSAHPSLTLVHYANALWVSLFKHEHISKDPVFQEVVPKWMEITAPRVIKAGSPSTRTSGIAATNVYSCLDYDSDEEFAVFFHRCRTDLLDAIRQATLVAPLVTFGYVERWLTVRIQKSAANPATECTLQSPEYLEWEGLSQVLDSVLSRILLVPERPSVASGLALLRLCLDYEPADPLLLSTLLSCISALFVFLSMTTAETSAALLPRVLDKIFAALVFSLPGQTKDSRSRVVKNVRRHAASLMVKIGSKYPLLLLPVFDQIHTTVQGLNRDPGQLSKLERVTLQEALLLISNHFCDYEHQTRFVGEVIGPGAEQWLALGQEAFSGPQEFMAFVGLDRPPVEPSSDDVNGQNRSHILFCVNLFAAVVKRCAWPDDPDRAVRGGFVVARTETGNPVCRNPAAPHIIPLLPNLLSLMRVCNSLWTPDALAQLSEGYRSAHGMLDVDRSNLLGVGGPALTEQMDMKHRAQTPLDRMQHFLTTLHDTCYHILGSSGPSLGRDFYQLSGLGNALIASVFSNLEKLPDYRVRPIVRVFLKPFVWLCPPAFHESVVLPVLAHFCPYMFQRLSNKWQYITQLYEAGGMDDENTDTQEVLEDMLNRTLTREYLDVLKVVLVGGGQTETAADAMEQQDMDGTDLTRGASSAVQAEVVSELGALILRTEATCQPVVLCILRALSWNDTIASLKASFLTAPVVRHLASDGSLSGPLAAHIMTSVLQGLQIHGQHEANQGSLLTLGAQVYEVLRPRFSSVVQVMNQIPNINTLEIQKLDEKIMSTSQKGNKVEKAKKEVFKRITSPLIGCSVGQLFRNRVTIADLPRMEFPRRPKPVPVDELPHQDIGLCDLFKTQ